MRTVALVTLFIFGFYYGIVQAVLAGLAAVALVIAGIGIH
jgi:hypothetical protein